MLICITAILSYHDMDHIYLQNTNKTYPDREVELTITPHIDELYTFFFVPSVPELIDIVYLKKSSFSV